MEKKEKKAYITKRLNAHIIESVGFVQQDFIIH